MSLAELKPTIAKLEAAPHGTAIGPVTIEETQQKVAKAEHSNGHRKGYDIATIRRYILDGKPVDILKAARAAKES